jgi:hypothetical protein
MDSLAITIAILTHPWQVLLSAVVLGHAARAIFSGSFQELKSGQTKKPIARQTPTPRQAA